MSADGDRGCGSRGGSILDVDSVSTLRYLEVIDEVAVFVTETNVVWSLNGTKELVKTQYDIN